VTVSVKSPNGNRIYVIGKVNHPGDFPLLRPIDVLQAISMAGGVTPFANTDKIRVLRREGSEQSSVRFRYGDVAKGRHLEQNILLQSGDTVIVP
jgi:polysaccharide export outer membrane protein